MPIFLLHLSRRETVEQDDLGMEFGDLHAAYLEACRAIPDIARDELLAGRDPMACAFLICDRHGRRLMEAPFTDVLSPAEWRRRPARHRPAGGARSRPARDRLALDGFRRMFAALDVGCVLMTPELELVEINDFGARHSHVDPQAIRGRSILDIFDLSGRPKRDFADFVTLAREGVTSEMVDLPYLVRDAHGATVHGWWKAWTWPILDDDGRVVGLVDWAEPSITPMRGGATLVRVGQRSTC